MKNKITTIEEYAMVLVNELGTINDGAALADSAFKLRQLDSKLQEKGLRAIVTVRTEKV